jgi:hypothetical protein
MPEQPVPDRAEPVDGPGRASAHPADPALQPRQGAALDQASETPASHTCAGGGGRRTGKEQPPRLAAGEDAEAADKLDDLPVALGKSFRKENEPFAREPRHGRPPDESRTQAG